MNKAKKKVNNFDSAVSTFAGVFSNVENFNVLQEDATGNKLLNMMLFRLIDISSYKDLVVNHFVPEVNKAIASARHDISTSIHKGLINIPQNELLETLHQTIRLSYVAIFHKLENFMSDILKMPDMLYGIEHEEGFNTYSKRVFNFDFLNWQQFAITHKINWISNCEKHKDGFPRKIPIPKSCNGLILEERIKLDKLQFKIDVEALLEFASQYLDIMFKMASYRFLVTSPNIELFKDDPKLFAKYEGKEKLCKELIELLIQGAIVKYGEEYQ